jgi:WD40 repeat protein
MRYRMLLAAALLVSLLVVQPQAPAQPGAPTANRRGDPLPPGALLRLGTSRYREDGGITAFAFAPNGQTYATAVWSWDGPVSVGIWHTATGRLLHRIATDAPFHACLAISPDGKTLAADHGTDVILWDTATGTKLRQFEGHPGGVACLAWSPDSKTLAVGGGVHGARSPDGLTSLGGGSRPDFQHRHGVRLLDAATGKLVRAFDEQPYPVRAVAFSADGQRLLSNCDVVCVWATATGKQLLEFDRVGEWPRKPSERPASVAFSPDLSRVAYLTRKGSLEVWDLGTGQCSCTIAAESPYWSFAFSADGKHLVLGAEDDVLSLWDAKTGQYVGDFAGQGGHGYTVVGVAPTGKYVASVSQRWSGRPTYLHLWDLAARKELTGGAGHQGAVTAVAHAKDGKRVLTAGRDRTVRTWDGATMPALFSRPGVGARSNLLLGPDGATVVEAMPGLVLVWDHPQGHIRQLVFPREGSPNTIGPVALAPDAKILAVAQRREGVALYDLPADRELRTLDVVAEAVAFAPDGRALAILGLKGEELELRLWRVATGKAVVTFQAPPGGFERTAKVLDSNDYVRTIAFSRDGRWLAVAECCYGRKGWRGTRFVVWETATGQLVRELTELSCDPAQIAFTPDGLALAATGSQSRQRAQDREATFWDVASGQLLGRVLGHAGHVSCLAFAPDGRTLLTGGSDGTVLVWDAAQLPRSKTLPPRQLAAAELAALWSDLAGDARAAFDAASWRGGRGSVVFLRKHLQPATVAPVAQIRQAIADLGDGRYAVRAKASALLETQGPYGEKALRAALKDGMNLEVRRRIELLLARLDVVPPPAELRTLRALAVLERIGSDEARALVETLAGGTPAARLTDEARAALARWPQSSP